MKRRLSFGENRFKTEKKEMAKSITTDKSGQKKQKLGAFNTQVLSQPPEAMDLKSAAKGINERTSRKGETSRDAGS